MPWFWCWEDAEEAALCAAAGRPFVLGPNVLFAHSRRPCATLAERLLCQAASCRLLFTESAWYRDLIARHLKWTNRAPIVLWPYPIVPRPGGPLEAEYDLLLYVKGDAWPDLVARATQCFPRSRTLRYGRYERAELEEVARRSGACLYLSDDDRGPLALAEILLSGCPTVGVPTGAPFVEDGRTGVVVPEFGPEECIAAIERCHTLCRAKVAAYARRMFDLRGTVATIVEALEEVREV
jgi:hypothetical protein